MRTDRAFERLLETSQVLSGERGDPLQRAIRWIDLDAAGSQLQQLLNRIVQNTPTVPPAIGNAITDAVTDANGTPLSQLIADAQAAADAAAADAVQALLDAQAIQAQHDALTEDFIGRLVDSFSAVDGRVDDLTDVVDAALIDAQELRGNVDRARESNADLQRAVALANQNLASALLRLAATEGTVRDAGIFIDPASGTVRIAAIDAVENRVNDVSIELDAVNAEISLKASVAYVNQAISEAILDPSQIPLLDDFELRITQAEIDISGAEAAIALKADATVVDGMEVRLSQAEVDIDGLESTITLKVDNATFNDVESRVTIAEQQISALDGASISTTLRDTRHLYDLSAEEAIATVGDLLRAHEERRAINVDIAYVQQDMHAVVTENREAIAQVKTELGSAIDGVVSALSVDYYTKASTDQAIASVTTLLTGEIDRVDGNIADVISLNLTPTSTILQRFTGLEGRVGDVEGSITQIADLTIDPNSVLASTLTDIQGDLSDASASITNILNLNISPTSALLNSINALDGRVETAEGAITDVLDLNISPTSALADSFTNINASIGAIEGQTIGDYTKQLLAPSDVTDGTAVDVTAGPAALDLPTSIIVAENSTARTLLNGSNGAHFLIPAPNTAMNAGQRVRVDVLARRDPTTPASSFSVAYVNHDTGNSGLKSFTHPGDNNWRWHTFYYDRPSGSWATEKQDRITLFGDNSKTGKKTQFSRVLVRCGMNIDVAPEIADLSGDITAVKALDLNALAGTAFGVLLDQLEVNAGGVSALITNHASALADLDGFSSAYAGITATTTGPGGSQISGFRATSYSNPNGSGNALLELLGDVVAEGTLATNRLVVGLGRNLLTNTAFKSGLSAGWAHSLGPAGTHRSQVSVSLNPPGSNWAGSHFPTVKIYQDGEATDGYADFYATTPIVNGGVQTGVPIQGGSWIDVSFRGSTHNCTCELYISFYDGNGASLGWSPIRDGGNKGVGDYNRPSNWPVYWGKYQSPANAAYAGILIRKKPTTSPSKWSALYIHEPQVAVTHSAATAPVPYSPQGTTMITGDEVVTGAIKATHADFESLAALGLTAGEADIELASITRGHLQDAIIGYAQIEFAEIDTLHLRGQAVTVPAHGWHPTEITVPQTIATIGWLTIVREVGFETRIEASLIHSGVSSTAWSQVFLTRQVGSGSEVTLRSFNLDAGGPKGRSEAFNYVDTNTSGGTTYYRIKMQMGGSLDPGNQALKVKDVAIQAIQFKR